MSPNNLLPDIDVAHRRALAESSDDFTYEYSCYTIMVYPPPACNLESGPRAGIVQNAQGKKLIKGGCVMVTYDT